ncbi:Aldose 1-epimerase [bacterium HR40]|nr:Aldose 1-epimerase [bacterium HR40]
MAVFVERVGEYRDRPVHAFVLRSSCGMEARLLDFGATLQSLRLPVAETTRELVLGFRDFADYPAKSPYFGATIGRYANRIGHGRFALNDRFFALSRNQDGRHTLHGGADNFSFRPWDGEVLPSGDGVRFTLRSPDGDQGFPGNLYAEVTFRLAERALVIEMEARADAPTPVNLAHHSYWNLDGGGCIDAHRLELAADFYLPVDAERVPTGEIREVAGTALDFRRLRRLDATGEPRFDHCFAVRGRGWRRVARLISGDGRVAMELFSDQPGVQLYTAFNLEVTASDGRHFGPRSGLCLETQNFPDAPNRSHFPDPFLLPGQIYRHVMAHRFAVLSVPCD